MSSLINDDYTENNNRRTVVEMTQQDVMVLSEMGQSTNEKNEPTTTPLDGPGGDVSLSCPYVEMSNNPTKQNSVNENDDDDDDDEADNHSYGKSIISSVLTADEIADPIGFVVVCMVILIGDMSRGVMFPTLWPLVESLGGNEVTQGYAVAAFSFGRILVSPYFGRCSVLYGYTITLLTSCSILLVGTLLYAQAERVGLPLFLIGAQTVLGIGSGTLGVTRAYVAEITPKRNRTTYLAWLTAVQYGGFTVTPFIGAMFTRWFKDEDRVVEKGLFVLNKYTAPAYFMSLIIIITIILLKTVFNDRRRDETKKGPKSKKRAAIDEFANSLTMFGITLYDACILGCMLLNVSTKGSIACFETLGIAIARSHFHMQSSQAGFIVSVCGAIGVSALLSMGYIAKYLSDVQMIAYGMVVMIMGVLCLTGLDDEDEGNPSWRYLLSIFLVYSIGYPIGHTAVIGLFSKIVGRRPQGTLLGWFASAGSLARIVFPLMSGYIVHYTNLGALFIMLTVVLGVSTFITMWNKETLTKLSI